MLSLDGALTHDNEYTGCSSHASENTRVRRTFLLAHIFAFPYSAFENTSQKGLHAVLSQLLSAAANSKA